jgi:hypothetical protein
VRCCVGGDVGPHHTHAILVLAFGEAGKQGEKEAKGYGVEVDWAVAAMG